MIENSGAETMIVDRGGLQDQHQGQGHHARRQAVDHDPRRQAGDWRGSSPWTRPCRRPPPSRPRFDYKPEDIVAIFFTSGTTGFPKGAYMTSDNLLFAQKIVACILPVAGVPSLFSLPASHVFGFGSYLIGLCEGLHTYYLPHFNAKDRAGDHGPGEDRALRGGAGHVRDDAGRGHRLLRPLLPEDAGQRGRRHAQAGGGGVPQEGHLHKDRALPPEGLLLRGLRHGGTGRLRHHETGHHGHRLPPGLRGMARLPGQDEDRRRRRQQGAQGRGRRGHGGRPRRLPGLLEQPRGHRRAHPGRLAAHRRHGLQGQVGPAQLRRPQEGRHQERRLLHLLGGSRARGRGSTRPSPRSRWSACPIP